MRLIIILDYRLITCRSSFLHPLFLLAFIMKDVNMHEPKIVGLAFFKSYPVAPALFIRVFYRNKCFNIGFLFSVKRVNKYYSEPLFTLIYSCDLFIGFVYKT